MKIEEVLKNIDYMEVHGDISKEIIDLSQDSRKAKKGTAFVAIPGLTRDGHDFIPEVINQGADIIFHEKELGQYLPEICYIRIKNTRKTMAEIASQVFGEPSKDFHLFGITGTNGKTTITYMMDHLLTSLGKKVATIGTNGVRIMGINESIEHTTPESPELQAIFRKFSDKGVEDAIMEVSSHALDLHRVDNSDFDYGVFTNLTMEHLDFHKNMENYYQAKKKLFERVTLSSIINIDDPYGKRLFKELKEEGKDIKSIGEKGDYSFQNLKKENNSYSLDFETPQGRERLELKTTAIFNVYNALSAIAICVEAGHPLEDLIRGMNTYAGAEGRYEIIENPLGFDIIIDFAHSPDALKNLLASAANPNGRTILVFGVSGDRREDIRIEMGKIAGEYADYSFITMDDPKLDTVENINKDIALGMDSVDGNYEIIDDRKIAIERAIDYCKENDRLYFAGKGHERFMKIGKDKIPFDERKIILDYIEQKRK